jgi:hypothetical protein
MKTLLLPGLLAAACLLGLHPAARAADYVFRLVSVEDIDRQLAPGMEPAVKHGRPTGLFEFKNTSKRPLSVAGIAPGGAEPGIASVVNYQARTGRKDTWKTAGSLSTGGKDSAVVPPGQTRTLRIGVFNLATLPQPGGEGRVGLRSPDPNKIYWSDPFPLKQLRKPE